MKKKIIFSKSLLVISMIAALSACNEGAVQPNETNSGVLATDVDAVKVRTKDTALIHLKNVGNTDVQNISIKLKENSEDITLASNYKVSLKKGEMIELEVDINNAKVGEHNTLIIQSADQELDIPISVIKSNINLQFTKEMQAIAAGDSGQFTVKNFGEDSAKALAISITKPDGTPVSSNIVLSSNCDGKTLLANESCDFTLTGKQNLSEDTNAVVHIESDGDEFLQKPVLFGFPQVEVSQIKEESRESLLLKSGSSNAESPLIPGSTIAYLVENVSPFPVHNLELSTNAAYGVTLTNPCPSELLPSSSCIVELNAALDSLPNTKTFLQVKGKNLPSPVVHSVEGKFSTGALEVSPKHYSIKATANSKDSFTYTIRNSSDVSMKLSPPVINNGGDKLFTEDLKNSTCAQLKQELGSKKTCTYTFIFDFGKNNKKYQQSAYTVSFTGNGDKANSSIELERYPYDLVTTQALSPILVGGKSLGAYKNGGTSYAYTDSTISISNDKLSWVNLDFSTGLPEFEGSIVKVFNDSQGNIYIFTNNKNKPLFKSTDNGISWQAIGRALPYLGGWGEMNIIYNGKSIIIVRGNTVISSADYGANWNVKRYKGDDIRIFSSNEEDGILYMIKNPQEDGMPQQILSSNDGGKTWVPMDIDLSKFTSVRWNFITDMLINGGQVYLALISVYSAEDLTSAIYASSDDGKSFTKLQSKFPDGFPYLVKLYQSNGILYGLFQNKFGEDGPVSPHRSLFYLKDGSWENTNIMLRDSNRVTPIQIQIRDGFVLLNNGVLYKGSENNWELVARQPNADIINVKMVNHAGSSYLAAGDNGMVQGETVGNIYSTRDYGMTWDKVLQEDVMENIYSDVMENIYSFAVSGVAKSIGVAVITSHNIVCQFDGKIFGRYNTPADSNTFANILNTSNFDLSNSNCSFDLIQTDVQVIKQYKNGNTELADSKLLPAGKDYYDYVSLSSNPKASFSNSGVEVEVPNDGSSITLERYGSSVSFLLDNKLKVSDCSSREIGNLYDLSNIVAYGSRKILYLGTPWGVRYLNLTGVSKGSDCDDIVNKQVSTPTGDEAIGSLAIYKDSLYYIRGSKVYNSPMTDVKNDVNTNWGSSWGSHYLNHINTYGGCKLNNGPNNKHLYVICPRASIGSIGINGAIITKY